MCSYGACAAFFLYSGDWEKGGENWDAERAVEWVFCVCVCVCEGEWVGG